MTETSAAIATCDQQPILVLGMHRSGTSVATGLLARLGAHAGLSNVLQPGDAHNLDGYFELQAAVSLNDRLLALSNWTWDAPPPADGEHQDIPPNFRAAIHRIVDRMQAEANALGRPWVLKDPRICLLWRHWLEAMPTARVVICTRNPIAVARSLAAREHWDVLRGLELCRRYFEHLLQIPSSWIALNFAYEALVEEPVAVARSIAARLQLTADADSISKAVAGVRQRSETETADEISLYGLRQRYEEVLRLGNP